MSRADRWPGAHFVKQILCGKRSCLGAWIDRTALYNARKKNPKAREADFTTYYTVRLSKLPVWSDLDDATYCERILELANAARDAAVGVKRLRIMMRDRHYRPKNADRSPAPDVLAGCRELREAWRQAYVDFCDAYTAAVEAVRAGEAAEFPAEGVAPFRRWACG